MLLPPPAPPALPDEIIEEIFLRLPPDEPACLVRASLTSKPWLSLLSGPSFHGRYREFHGAPPMLGFVYSSPPYSGSASTFVSTTKFGARIPDEKESVVLDCRHGRVLLGKKKGVEPMGLVVWDPMTGCRRELHAPKDYYYGGHGEVAALLCAVTGCNHRACHEGPFRVVFVSLDKSHGACVAYACMSLPEVGEWSKQCSDLQLVAEWSNPRARLDLATQHAFMEPTPPLLIQDTLYFIVSYDYDNQISVLMYDMGSNSLSLLHVSLPGGDFYTAAMLIAMDDGSLGFAHQDGLTLNLWSRPISSDGVLSWMQRRVVDLKELFPIKNPKQTLRLIGYVEGSDIIFMITDLGIYKIDLKSLQSKKIWKRERLSTLIPYMSFYTPQERGSPSGAAY